MDYGIVLPHFGSFAREDAAQRIVAAAEAAEALGYSTVWVVDHLVLPAKVEGGYAFNPLDPFLHVYLSFRAWTGEFTQLMELMARFARETGLRG